MNGPLVLAAQVPPGKPFPVIVAEEGLLSSLQPVDGKPSTSRGRPTSSACRAATKA